MSGPIATVPVLNAWGQLIAAVIRASSTPVHVLCSERSLLLSIDPNAPKAAPADYVGTFDRRSAEPRGITDKLLEHLGE